MILGARRSLDKYLPADQQLNAPYPSLTITKLQQGLTRFKNDVEQSIAEQLSSELNNELTTRQKTFINKLERIEKFKEPIIQMLLDWFKEWNTENPQETAPGSRWRHLKVLSREVANFLVENGQPKTGEYAYRSILRGILITALLPYYDEGQFVTQLMVKGIVAVDKLIAKPFSKTKPSYQQKLPLQLLMGSKYVIGRPGNSAKMTKLARETGEITLQFWSYRNKKLLVEGKIRLHKSLLSFLKQGAKIALLVIAAGDAPAHKLKVTIVMTGKRKMFFTRDEINKLQKKLPDQVISPPQTKSNDGIGLDVNRLGEFMLIFSEEYPNELPKIQLKLIERYQTLACPISELGVALTRKRKHYKSQPGKEAHIAWLKVKGELERVYKRRHRLLKNIHQKAGQWVATVLYHSNTSNLIIEDLKLTAKGTRGALAKIILSLPDEQDLFERATLQVEWLTGKKQTLILVDPRNTSQGEHVACTKYPKGKIKRKENEWDYAQCNACDKQVNTHHNAAMIIRQRGLDYLAKIS